jgi:DNA-binding response OmpR family regulator/HPt (histidine-containing phosphotransfer) domain-containing protein
MKKILIIEDDSIVAHIYRNRLEKEGYTVEVCEDGQAGFYRIHEFHPSAILLDLMLPKMNGIDILKKIRAEGEFRQTPVIVFTNAYVPNMIQEAMSAGASVVCNKATLTPRQVLDALSNLLNGLPATPSQPKILPLAPAPSNNPTARRGDPLFQSSTPGGFEGSPPPQRGFVTPDDVDSTRPGLGRAAVPRPSQSMPTAAESAEDAAFQAELTEAFNAAKIDTISTLRKHAHGFTKSSSDTVRMQSLLDLYRKVHSLTGSAGIAGFTAVSQFTAALEVLLKELYDKPKNINASTMRTVVYSVDFLAELFKNNSPQPEPISSSGILVVDDEILSRRAVTYALEKAGLKSVSVEDPLVALQLSTENAYDLIFLDVQMPGLDGFELCSKIRAMPTNKTTPVIFVTSLTDFKSRARSSLSGGNDLIAKPFMFIELAVKALTHVIRGRVVLQKQAA